MSPGGQSKSRNLRRHELRNQLPDSFGRASRTYTFSVMDCPLAVRRNLEDISYSLTQRLRRERATLDDSGDPQRLSSRRNPRLVSVPGDKNHWYSEVESLCAEALRAIEAGDRTRAREILEDATRRNADARSPLVPHYVANLAVLSGDLFTAVSAQKEALRLDPGNRLYRDNFLRLLTVPYDRAIQGVDHLE